MPPGSSAKGSQKAQTMTLKETVQSSAGLGAGGQARLRAGMVSEDWKKWAIVCLRSLPQGHEAFLLLSPETEGPAVQDNTVNEASLSCPQLRRHMCILQTTNGIASALCCTNEVSFQSARSRFRESMNFQFGIWSGELKDLKLRHHHVQQTQE